jgi:hypothetical protein
MRALLEPCCGAFNNTQAEDVFFLRPVNAQAEDSLAKCALSVGLAFSRELKQNKFWEDAMKEFKNYMGASEVRGHQQKELCTLIAAQVNILSTVPGGASDVDGDTKLSNAKVDLTNLLKKWWDRFPGDRESLRPDALVVPHEKTIKPACLALFNADVRDESMDNFDERDIRKRTGCRKAPRGVSRGRGCFGRRHFSEDRGHLWANTPVHRGQREGGGYSSSE